MEHLGNKEKKPMLLVSNKLQLKVQSRPSLPFKFKAGLLTILKVYISP